MDLVLLKRVPVLKVMYSPDKRLNVVASTFQESWGAFEALVREGVRFSFRCFVCHSVLCNVERAKITELHSATLSTFTAKQQTKHYSASSSRGLIDAPRGSEQNAVMTSENPKWQVL